MRKLLNKHFKKLDHLNNGKVKQATNYERAISNLIETHAPSIQRTVKLRPQAAWYTEELRETKRLRRNLESQCIHSKLYL